MPFDQILHAQIRSDFSSPQNVVQLQKVRLRNALVFTLGQFNWHGTEHSHDLATCIDASLPVVLNVNIDRMRRKIAKRLTVSSFTNVSCISCHGSLESHLSSAVDGQNKLHAVLIRKRDGYTLC